MEELLKADIFFFITTIAVVLVSAFLVVAIFYAIKILKNVRYISDRVKEESDEIIEDVKNFRQGVKKEGLKFKTLIDFFFGMFVSKKGSKGKKGKDKN